MAVDVAKVAGGLTLLQASRCRFPCCRSLPQRIRGSLRPFMEGILCGLDSFGDVVLGKTLTEPLEAQELLRRTRCCS